jgi:formyl-CoA transferase
MAGPLEGVRVLDFSEIIAAPYAGMLLADMGADVIKVEPPWGEPWRLIQQFIPLESRTYMAVNRGKRSLPLDLSRPEGREVVHRLLSGTPDMPGADVVIHNYRPGVASRLGIDYETLSGKSPTLIYCEATAFGTQGPHSQRPGYDIIVQAMSGIMASEGKSSEGVPQHVFTPVVDTATGISMAWAICAALYAREKTGRGRKIEASLLATALGMHGSRFLSVEAVDAETQGALKEEIDALRQGGRPYNELEDLYLSYHGSPRGNIYYRTYQTRDGVLAVGCLSDPLRHKLLNVLGLSDMRYAPGYIADSPEAQASGEELTAQAEALFRERATSEWITILDEAGVPSGPVRFAEELLEDEHVIANEMVVEMDHPLAGRVKMAGPLVKMSETVGSAQVPYEPPMKASPGLGQHTDEILGSLGYSREQIDRLKGSGITCSMDSL